MSTTNHFCIVKPEPTPSPDISNFQFSFNGPILPNHFRASWPQQTPQRYSNSPIDPSYYYPSPMSYSDGYEGVDGYDDIAELSLDTSGMPSSYAGASSTSAAERNVRRRSSKACDQCRKSKCKCERASPNEACKNCLMLGTPCTFLGPSRKRGPPKGYIDAIEARLHQTEALIGIMLATTDSRAQSLLRDIAMDSLAKEIINRVDNSPYGVKGRKREDIALSVGKLRSGNSSDSGHAKPDSAPLDLTSTHPSNEWQDRVASMLNVAAENPLELSVSQNPTYAYHSPQSQSSDDNISPNSRRQRRRVGDEDYHFPGNNTSKSAAGSTVSLNDTSGAGTSTNAATLHPPSSATTKRNRPKSGSLSGTAWRRERSSSVDTGGSIDSDSEEELLGAVGQLSLNEEEQVRYHGKASGLHLLGNKERVDRRNEGGIWRFPKARVWPPLPSGSKAANESEFLSSLPSQDRQSHLLDLYFTYVHPFFPVIHKRSFLETFKAGMSADSPASADPNSGNETSPFSRRRRLIPTLLLLTMFALASRYDPETTPPPSDPTIMWSAGDEYLESAKLILDSTYASSKSTTVQALLLMGYREVGIGAMAQAWTYIGMAIRMAQDLGMHRVADGWKREGLGGRLFNEGELAERKRIWFGCVILDKYISAYIGRPLMILETDFDTILPNVDDLEESEEWSGEVRGGDRLQPMPGRVISCFNASSVLSGILGKIVQSIYAIRPNVSRHAESTILESILDKWYLELPDHLRCDLSAPSTASSSSTSSSSRQSTTPLPNVLTLHMQYWCTVLLLHRPFITPLLNRKNKQAEDEDPETKARIARSYELCQAAANHVASLVAFYQDKYFLERCPIFLCYYVFSASIMHDTHLSLHPTDPQGQLGFEKCYSSLNAMRILWPGAGRAFDLFFGTKTGGNNKTGDPPSRPMLVELTHPSRERNKRAAEQPLNDVAMPSVHNIAVLPTPLPPISRSTPPQYSSHPSSRRDHPPMRNAPYPQHRNGRSGAQPPSIYTYGIQPQGSLGSPSSPASANYSASGLPSTSAYWGMGGFSDPLSTAVLPELYSSGLDLDAHVRGMQSPMMESPHHTHHHQTGSQSPYDTFPRRSSYVPPTASSSYYDYATEQGGMGTQPQSSSHMGGYSSSPQQPQQPQPGHPSVQHQHSQLYLGHQYGLYGGPYTGP
ncbi:fungal-specific transcription factor domain-containing protein [Crepidotus variabilis]|uniref:Fungal-specific transcription factor domain-containing protein n=1 Tax=Crepidotus variabilis TaxID=179855 RepID=A0A9P6EKR3_9AGAR|nr:fungal-specific transcription factor domain-containing protein [Crepidotus variabilis]